MTLVVFYDKFYNVCLSLALLFRPTNLYQSFIRILTVSIDYTSSNTHNSPSLNFWCLLINSCNQNTKLKENQKKICMILGSETRIDFVICFFFGYHSKMPRAISRVCLLASSSFEFLYGCPTSGENRKTIKSKFKPLRELMQPWCCTE